MLRPGSISLLAAAVGAETLNRILGDPPPAPDAVGALEQLDVSPHVVRAHADSICNLFWAEVAGHGIQGFVVVTTCASARSFQLRHVRPCAT